MATPDGDDHGRPDHRAAATQLTEELTNGEQAAFDDAREMLESPEGAQDVARSAAALCLIQFKRSGDSRFIRRFENISVTFGLAPDDVDQ